MTHVEPGRIDWKCALRRHGNDIDNRGVHVYETQRVFDAELGHNRFGVLAIDQTGQPFGELEVDHIEKPEQSVWMLYGADGTVWTCTLAGCGCGG